MKKFLLLLVILALYSCKGTTEKQPIENIQEKEVVEDPYSKTQIGIVDLGIKEVKKGKKADWYKNFPDFRENYKQIKMNSDIFIGIGGIYLSQEEAMESARYNGEINVKNSLAISSTTKENFGNIIDSVLEVHNVEYNGELTVAYKYNLLLEVNKVSAFQVIDEENRQIEEARLEVEKKLSQAKEYELEGDLSLKGRAYSKAIINYRNAKAIYEETDSIEQADKITEKIFLVREQQQKEKMNFEVERKRRLREINELEVKKNLNEFELAQLKQLYLDIRQIKKAEETEARLQDLLTKKDMLDKQSRMRQYIKGITGDAYLESNYTSYYNNFRKYFPTSDLDALLLKKDILDEISEDSLVILFDRNYFKNKYLNLFTNVLAYKYGKIVKLEVKEDDFNMNLIYKYKAWNLISVNTINLVAEQGRYGYRGVFSASYNYADFKNGLSNLVTVPATRSRHTDHETPEQALTQVIDNELTRR